MYTIPAGTRSSTTQLRFYNSTTQLPHNNRIAPRGTTVLLECRVTPHQRHCKIHYSWTCPQPPCDGEYRKVYNNLILIVATATTGGQYTCTPTPHGNEVSATLTVLTSLTQGKMPTVYCIEAIYYNICPPSSTTLHRYSCSLQQK